jgi:hypothetical protein
MTLRQYRSFSTSPRFSCPCTSILLGLSDANVSETSKLPRSFPQTPVTMKMGSARGYGKPTAHQAAQAPLARSAEVRPFLWEPPREIAFVRIGLSLPSFAL